jgi:hypothetical protein
MIVVAVTDIQNFLGVLIRCSEILKPGFALINFISSKSDKHQMRLQSPFRVNASLKN